MRQTVISSERAQELLAPLHPILSRIVRRAWKRWREDVEPAIPLWSTRGKRNAMADLMVDEARAQLADVRGVLLRETGDGRFLVQIGQVLLFFKHLGPGDAISNYRTRTAVRFNSQFVLPGIPQTRLIVGYETDVAETDLNAVRIVCRIDKRLIWSYELAQPGADNIVIFPKQGRFDLDGSPRVRPAAGAAAKKAKNSGGDSQ